MPVKWTPENDQLLLTTIFETNPIKLDYHAVADAWPNPVERPTHRAISERIAKIRKTTKSSPVKTSATTDVKAPSTSRRRGPNKTAQSKASTTLKSGQKRKLSAVDGKGEDAKSNDASDPNETSSQDSKDDNNVLAIKAEPNGREPNVIDQISAMKSGYLSTFADFDVNSQESPAKKVRYDILDGDEGVLSPYDQLQSLGPNEA